MAIAAFFFLNIDSSFAAKRAGISEMGGTSTIDKPTKAKRKGKKRGKKRSAAARVVVIEAPPAPVKKSKIQVPFQMKMPTLPAANDALLTKIGYGAAVASIVLAVVSDGGQAPKKRPRPSGQSSVHDMEPAGRGGKGRRAVAGDDEEDTGAYDPKADAARGQLSRPSALPPAGDLLGDIDGLLEQPASSSSSKAAKQQDAEAEEDSLDSAPSEPSPPARRSVRAAEAERADKRKSAMAAVEAAKKEDVEEEDRAEQAGEREQASVQSPAQKKGVFDRIFAKPGGNRNTDARQVLALKDDAQSFRREVALSLVSFVGAEAFGDLLGGASADATTDEARVAALVDARQACGLSQQQAGDSFADVASAMLVAVVDAAAAALDAGDAAGATARLDIVADFVQGAAVVFGRVAEGAVIEPVLYNGSVKRGKLETLYFEYLKSTMSADSMMAMFGGGAPEGEGSPAADRTTKLPSIQQVFSIKENKRSSLEQKALRENLMSLGGGLGEGGGLGGIMDALSGKGGADGMDMAQLEEMMKGMDPEALRGAAGLPDDMDNMNPEEMAAMSKDAMSSVKAALEDGSITKNDIAELEKVMGLDISLVVKMMDSGNVDKAKLKEMGPEFGDMLSVFKQLAALKKKL